MICWPGNPARRKAVMTFKGVLLGAVGVFLLSPPSSALSGRLNSPVGDVETVAAVIGRRAFDVVPHVANSIPWAEQRLAFGGQDQFLRDLKERLGQFALDLHPDKTRLIEFGALLPEDEERRLRFGAQTDSEAGHTNLETAQGAPPRAAARRRPRDGARWGCGPLRLGLGRPGRTNGSHAERPGPCGLRKRPSSAACRSTSRPVPSTCT